MSLFSLFFRPARSTARRFRLSLESLEGREMMSASPITPPNDLVNPIVKRVAQAEYVRDNGHLGRTDVINLINVVDNEVTPSFSARGQVSFSPSSTPLAGTLSGQQLTDLQTLAANPSRWGMPGYVADLLGKLVNDNVANKSVNEGPNQTPTTLLPSDELAAGDPDSTMNVLEGKWFYGTDLPSLQNVTAGLPSSLGTITYQEASGKLFGLTGPSANDVAQGWVGDCFFMSALGETARRDPQAIQNMFLNNGDGTYTVRFFNNGTPDYVTVNKELPVTAAGNFLFANWYSQGATTSYTHPKNVLWVALAEKAYAQLAQEGWSRSTSTGSGIAGETPSDSNQNCYDGLNYGISPIAIQQITGSTAAIGGETILGSNGKAVPGAEQELIKAWSNGDLVVLGSFSQEPSNVPTDPAGAPEVVSNHVYSLSGYNARTGKFTLTNPYADGDSYWSGDGARTVTLTWAQLQEFLHDFTFVKPTRS